MEIVSVGIFGSMVTALTGLRSQSFALENISSNIANSQTTGYKRVDTSFSDLVTDQPLSSQIGGSVRASSRGTNTIAGSYASTGVGTNVALNGEGFFVVRQRVDSGGRGAVFGQTDLYTRRGDFAIDRDGFLVNGSDGYLVGTAVDKFTGVNTGAAPDVIRVVTDQVPPLATTTIEYRGNLPAYPRTGAADRAVTGSELLSPAGFAVNPNTATGTVRASEEASFLNQTLPGGSVTVYDGLGTPVNMELRWGKSANAGTTGTPPVSTPDTWQLFYNSNARATGAAVKWTNAGTPFTFNSSTQLTSPTGQMTIPGMTINGTNFGNVAVNLGLTQASAISGQVQTSQVRQDGYSSGDLSSVTMNDDGRVVGNYTNGTTIALAQVSVAQFNAANMLKRVDGGTFEATIESGTALIGMNATTMTAGQIESSNTDIAEEFAKMIVTQQAYSANTRVVTTAQQMLQDTINIVR
jgi:flagellar hook protein FlgE